MSRWLQYRHIEDVQRFFRGPGGRGACSVTDRATIKRTTTKRRRANDEDHIDEGLLELGGEDPRSTGVCGACRRLGLVDQRYGLCGPCQTERAAARTHGKEG